MAWAWHATWRRIECACFPCGCHAERHGTFLVITLFPCRYTEEQVSAYCVKGAAAGGHELGAIMASFTEVRTLGDGPAENCPSTGTRSKLSKDIDPLQRGDGPEHKDQPLSTKCWRRFEKPSGVPPPRRANERARPRQDEAHVQRPSRRVGTKRTLHPALEWFWGIRLWWSTWGASMTLKEHLTETHMMSENFLSNAARLLPAWHPIRRLVAPFVWFGNQINTGALKSLMEPGSLAYELFAFDDSGFTKAAVMALTTYEIFHQ